MSWKDIIPEPAVPRRGLIIGAGVVWSSAGGMLLFRAATMIPLVHSGLPWILPLSAAIGWLKARLVFSRIVKDNIRRIEMLSPHKDKVCLFAFQPWRSYLVVIVMVALGLWLRHSSLSPAILVAVYVAIAVALLVSGVKYFRIHPLVNYNINGDE